MAIKTNRRTRMSGLFLAGVMLAGGVQPVPAAAQVQENEVGGFGTYTVEETYTVTVPESVQLSPPVQNGEGEEPTAESELAAVTLKAGANISAGSRLAVYVKETDSVRGGQLLLERCDAAGNLQEGVEADTVTVSLDQYDTENDTYVQVAGSTPLGVYSDMTSEDITIGTLRMTPSADALKAKAGLYKGNIVFTISIESSR